jgi:hypothetical protein
MKKKLLVFVAAVVLSASVAFAAQDVTYVYVLSSNGNVIIKSTIGYKTAAGVADYDIDGNVLRWTDSRGEIHIHPLIGGQIVHLSSSPCLK